MSPELCAPPQLLCVLFYHEEEVHQYALGHLIPHIFQKFLYPAAAAATVGPRFSMTFLAIYLFYILYQEGVP